MKIYDCFTFLNEFELLELRLRELYDHVDYFVIVEANRTFQNNFKPLYYADNHKRFDQWKDKIIYVSVTDMPEHTDTWGRERHQRDAILRGLPNAEPNDIIMIGDADEIPRVETVQRLRSSSRSIWGFRMPLFNIKFNYMMVTQDYYSVWSGAFRFNIKNSPEDFRRMRHQLNSFPYNYQDDNVEIVEHAGWHFTYLGNEEFAKIKIQSFAHNETNQPQILDKLDINQSIASGDGIIAHPSYKFTTVAVDDYLPQTIINNPEEFADNLITNLSAVSARQHLPAML